MTRTLDKIESINSGHRSKPRIFTFIQAELTPTLSDFFIPLVQQSKSQSWIFLTHLFHIPVLLRVVERFWGCGESLEGPAKPQNQQRNKSCWSLHPEVRNTGIQAESLFLLASFLTSEARTRPVTRGKQTRNRAKFGCLGA